MTGPEHYARAEEMLEVVERLIDGDNRLRDAPILQAYSAAAQVHATLALAAATALSQRQAPRAKDVNAWEEAAGTFQAAQEYVKARGDHIASQH